MESARWGVPQSARIRIGFARTNARQDWGSYVIRRDLAKFAPFAAIRFQQSLRVLAMVPMIATNARRQPPFDWGIVK